MPKLRLASISKRYPGAAHAALDGVDLAVEEGQVLVLVGPSGCGKSTALRLIAGLDLPDAGRIELDGRDLADVPPQERDVAMVFQGYALYPHMTVAENIAFPLKMRGVAAAQRAEKVAEAAALLGIDKLLARLPGELSGGERQRVAMGRAIVRKPKIFLFDEPLSNLDAALRASLRVELARLLRTLRATAIYVTHDQVEAMTLGDEVAVMRAGAIQQLGRPRAIYEGPRTTFVAKFLGAPAINLLRPEWRDGAAHFEGKRLQPPRGVAPRGPVLLGIRPERVEVKTADDPAPEKALSWVAEVTMAEPLGAETVLHCTAPAGTSTSPVRAKVPGFFDSALSDSVRLVVDPAHIHWFDAESEERLEPARPVERREPVVHSHAKSGNGV